MNSLLFISWSLLTFVIIYHHVLYSFVLSFWAKHKSKENKTYQGAATTRKDFPFISVVVPCFNEAAVIAEKMRNFAFIDYPTDRFKVVLVNDGSTDATAAIIAHTKKETSLVGMQFEVINAERNVGKVVSLNRTLDRINQGLVVLSDTSALISIDAFQRLANHFDDQNIGVVCGTYDFLNPGSAGEQKYWHYQTAIKTKESQTGSTLGAHGALYAFRAEQFVPLAMDTINDDFILPMTIVSKGQRCIYDTDIIAVELEQASDTQDHNRRRRIAAGNLQQALRLVSMLHPKHGAVAFNFASGKFLRAFMPFILITYFLVSGLLSGTHFLFSLAFASQALVYGVSLLRHWSPTLPWPKAVNLVYYLVSGYAANLFGSVHYLVQPEHYKNWGRAESVAKRSCYVDPVTIVSKRLFDIVVAMVGIVSTLPLWPLIGLAIKYETKGPMFFRQMRVGRSTPTKTELFMMTKFRTMGVNAESKTGAVWATANDPRITKVGYFLRKTRLDELPQLLNVLAGDMSIVGPRPERPGISRDLNDAIPYYAERTYFVTPGITGLAQVSQGYDTCLDDVKSKLLYDHAYALSLSNLRGWITMDLIVMFRTVWVMVAGRGQ